MKAIKPYKWPSNKKRKRGRASTYRPDIHRQLEAYLRFCKNETFTNKKGEKIPSLPSIQEFAMRLGASRNNFYVLARSHQNYKDVLEQLKTAQAAQLINFGLTGKYKPQMVVFLLKRSHGYRIK